MARATATSQTPQSDVDDRIAFADAALALAGHEVTDSWSRDVMERVARDELTGDEAVAAIRRHFQA